MTSLWISYYFDKSAKRKEELREFQEFTDTKKLKIIKHCKTCLLSLERVVKRVLQQWFALHGYFDRISESDNSSRVMRLNQYLNSPLTKLVLLFLEFALDSMCKFNAIFQSSLPMLPALKVEVKRLLKILLGRFIKSDAIQQADSDLTQLDLCDSTLQLPQQQLGFGHSTWAYFSDEEDFLDTRNKDTFLKGVKEFYTAIASTMMKKFSFSDNVVDDVVFVSPENRAIVNVDAIFRMAERFSAAVDQEVLDSLEEEVLDYKLGSPHEMPSFQKESARPTNSIELCSYWQVVGKMKTLSGSLRFPKLTSLAKCILALPVSNADTERVLASFEKLSQITVLKWTKVLCVP